jgi:hypothetical protein
MTKRLNEEQMKNRQIRKEKMILTEEKEELINRIEGLEECNKRDTAKMKDAEKTNEDLMAIIESANEGGHRKVDLI